MKNGFAVLGLTLMALLSNACYAPMDVHAFRICASAVKHGVEVKGEAMTLVMVVKNQKRNVTYQTRAEVQLNTDGTECAVFNDPEGYPWFFDQVQEELANGAERPKFFGVLANVAVEAQEQKVTHYPELEDGRTAEQFRVKFNFDVLDTKDPASLGEDGIVQD